MAEQYEKFRAAGAEIIAVVKDTPEEAKAYFSDHDIPFPCLADPTHQTYEEYEVRSRLLSLGQRPALFVIDREGVVRYAHLGWQQWEIPQNSTVLDECRKAPCRADAALGGRTGD